MNRPGTLLLTGATGFIGSALVKHFTAKGWKVIALVRSDLANETPGIHYQHFDLASPRLDSDTFKGVDVFIHAAYIKDSKGGEGIEQNVNGSRQLIESAHRNGVGQCIFISSLAAHEGAESNYGKQKSAIEKLFAGPKDAVIRPGLVLGDGGLFATLRDHIRKGGRIPLIGGGNQPLQTVLIDDLVAAVAAVIDQQQHGTFTIAEPEAIPYRRFYEAMCETLQVKPRFMKVSYFALGTAIRLAGLIGKKLPINRDNLLGLKNMRFVESAQSLQQLGIRVRSYKESLAELSAK